MGKTYEQLLDRQQIISRIEKKMRTKVVTLYQNSSSQDSGMITGQTVDDFQIAMDSVGPYDPLMLIIDSKGGLTYSGYCIAATLARRTTLTICIVPKEALSAATMVALSGKKLVLFPDASLSPIDPQYIYKGRSVSALDFLDNRDRAIRASAQRQIDLAEENLRAVCGSRIDSTKLDAFVERFLLKDKIHAAHGSNIYSDEIRKLGLRVKNEVRRSHDADNDLKALHTLYKMHSFTKNDPSTIIEYTRNPIIMRARAKPVIRPKYFVL
jgi:ATP-dependent protease ClpP protease subunit